jgi:CheY-like chemotaxis protein
MAARRALVVDDSRSARAFLTRILEGYELAVDGVESAEQAIEYLTHQRPDVIFMDHLMPGMDGFQAVQAIKNNPLTATIPIMMYTSQEGELYLSQARALGAIGVLPKQTQHTDVSKALEQLRLLGEPRLESEIVATPPEIQSESEPAPSSATLEDTADIAAPAAPAPPPSAREAARPPLTVDRRGTSRPDLPALSPELRAIVESMVLHHIRELQRFVADNLESQADRVVADVRLMLKDQPPPPSPYGPPPEGSRSGFWVGAAGVLIACLALWQWQQLRLDSTALSAQLAEAHQQLDATHTQLQSVQAADAAGAGSTGGYAEEPPAPNSTIEPVPYGEMPLAGSRLDRIQSLLAKLNAQGFQGEVDIRSIPGRFCMVTGSGQNPILAADNWPFTRCEQIGNPREDNGSVSLRQSVAFANMIATARQNGNGKLDIQISAGTPDETITPYPPVSDALTAGEWNRVAFANNRVEVHWQAKR